MRPKAQSLVLLSKIQFISMLLAASGLMAPWTTTAGFFTALSSPLPGSFFPGHMLLLSDGRVMVQNSGGNGWEFLTPDNHGHYVNGTWSAATPMNDSREYYSSDVLMDGRVFVAGGEYGSGAATAELFDPQGNHGAGSWTYINPPTSLLNPSVHSPALAAINASGNQAFLDSESMILPNGNVLVAPVGPNVQGGTLIYNPFANTWSAGGTTLSVYQDETSWVKLPDDSILTIDPYGTTCQRYITASNTWILDRNVPVNLWATSGEIGAALLLTNGTVLYIGGNNATEIYTPSGGLGFGSWAPGPNLPAGLVMRDAPAAMLANGNALITLVAATGDQPFYIYEFNQDTLSFTQVFYDNSVISDGTSMLDLPDGNVLFNDTGTVYVYQADPSPVPAGRPTINSITQNGDGSYHLTGTKLNGISQGAAYGDDAQMDSNYPLVRMSNNVSSNVYYAHTYNWSSTSVMTGNTPVTTEFTLPTVVLEDPGSYSLVVVANGNASDPVTFYGPVWVDFTYSGSPKNGSYINPFSTLAQGTNAVPSGGTIASKGATINAGNTPAVSHETMTIRKPMTIISVGGSATIGH